MTWVAVERYAQESASNAMQTLLVNDLQKNMERWPYAAIACICMCVQKYEADLQKRVPAD